MRFDQVHTAIKRFNANFYRWTDTTDNQPEPGAEAFAFSSYMLPIQEWIGPGEPVMYQLMAYSRPYYIPQMIIPTGIAGILAGQIAPNDLGEMP
jgi:hypothetical protein